MNWGYKIILLYVAFVTGILYLVYRSSKEQIDLVTENYYDKEIEFQQQIQREQNAASSNMLIEVAYDSKSGIIEITYPSAINNKNIKGNIKFFRPDDANKDFVVPVNPVNHRQQVNAEKLKRGYWRIQTTWEVDGLPLYQEEKLYLQ